MELWGREIKQNSFKIPLPKFPCLTLALHLSVLPHEVLLTLSFQLKQWVAGEVGGYRAIQSHIEYLKFYIHLFVLFAESVRFHHFCALPMLEWEIKIVSGQHVFRFYARQVLYFVWEIKYIFLRILGNTNIQHFFGEF